MRDFSISLIGLRKEAGVHFELEAQDLLTFIDYLYLETADEIDEKQISKAADRWAARQPQPPNVIHFRNMISCVTGTTQGALCNVSIKQRE